MSQLSTAKIFRYGGVAFLVGSGGAYWISSFFCFSSLYLYILLVVLLFLFKWKKKRIAFIILITFCFFLGIYRFQNVLFQLNQTSFFKKDNVTLQITLPKEPFHRENYQKVVASPLVIYLGSYPIYHYGDSIQVNGTVEPVDWYLDGSSFVSGKMSYPKAKLLQSASFSWPQLIFNIRKRITLVLGRVMPEPENSLLIGLLLGKKDSISSNLQDQIRKAGLAHIIVVSGLHLSIIIRILISVLISLGLRKRATFIFLICFLLFFSGLVGFTASIIRASIMAFLLLLSSLYSRLYKPGNSLLLAAILMVWFNPLIMKGSLGFQLSFLATAGIIFLYPIWARKSFWQKKFFQGSGSWLMMTVLPSLSALTMVLPWIAYKMQYVSLVTPFTNLMVLPFLPLVIVLGVITIIGAMICYPLGLFFSFFLSKILAFILLIIRITSSLSISQVYIPTFLLWGLIPYYLFISLYIYRQQKQVT